jgi:hypothetical protein
MKQNLNEYFTNIITNAKRQKMKSGVASQVANNEAIRKGIHRVPSASEINQQAVKPLHHYVFCSHQIPYWRPCTKCGRDRVLAQRNADMIFKKANSLVDSLKS